MSEPCDVLRVGPAVYFLFRAHFLWNTYRPNDVTYCHPWLFSVTIVIQQKQIQESPPANTGLERNEKKT